MSMLQASELQGLLYSSYSSHRYASYLLARFGDPAQGLSWVENVARRVSFGDGRGSGGRVNVGFTSMGLQALGVSQKALETFSPAYWDGMDSPYRSRILGDTGPNAPEHWEWGGTAEKRVHALVAVFSRDEEQHQNEVARETASLAGFGAAPFKTLVARPRRSKKDPAEHFGFADGVSQPVFAGDPRAASLTPEEKRLHLVPTGEFVLGWDNAYQEQTPVPRIDDGPGVPFGANGTYLVFRQLRQDVARFWQYLDREAARIGRPVEWLAAKTVGRWRDGSPLTLCPNAPNSALSSANVFTYAAEDRLGERCPIGAHIRRSNPRDSLDSDSSEAIKDVNGHRLLRRGRSYGERIENPRADDGIDRGLFFLCLNGNIERQFEFVQYTWINLPSFGGLCDEHDPIIGTQPDGGGFLSLPGQPIRERAMGLPQFVTMRGGAYFFVPSRAGLDRLARLV